MNAVYVVTQCWNDYGGGETTPILVTPNHATAEAKVAEMQARQRVRSSVDAVIREYMKSWDIINPRPQEVLDKKKKTKEQPLPLGEQFRNWAATRYAESVRFTSTFTQAEQEDYRELNDNLFWEIETVPYQE